MNQYLQTNIVSCHKELERRAVYLEQSTAHFNNVVNTTIYGDIITSQKEK